MDTAPIRVGDVVFCRCNLHRGEAPSVARGQRGTVMRAGPDDNWLCKFDDDDGKAWLPGKWLEASPGTFSLGFKAIMERTHGFYSSGPLVTDLMFPEHRRTSSETPEHSGAARFYQHYRTLSRSGFGFSFYDGINAQNRAVTTAHPTSASQLACERNRVDSM